MGYKTQRYSLWVRAKNILTYFQKVSKKVNDPKLLEVYQFLCEFAHPNVLGNIRFLTNIGIKHEDGSFDILMRQYAESNKNGRGTGKTHKKASAGV